MKYTNRKLTTVLFILSAFCVGMTGCKDGFKTVTATVTGEDQFGAVILDLEKIDLEYGDSVNLSFSGGYEVKEVPYYPDFYGNKGSVILTDHYDTLRIAGVGCSFNSTAGIQSGEKVAITLEKEERYKDAFEAYNINSGTVREEGQSEEAFRNAREITTGQILENRLYRGSSPFDQVYGRIELMEQYLRENDINCVLNLTDTSEKLETYENLPDHTVSMLSNNQVISCPIGVDYLDPKTMQTLGQGLAEMSEMEGPYMIHCSLGRDRTGVVCAVIEALCGASYQEIIDDFMASYDLIHNIDMNPDSLQYKLFKQRIDEQLEAIFGIAIEELPVSDLKTPAYNYLLRCGMNEQQIDRLINYLVTDDFGG